MKTRKVLCKLGRGGHAPKECLVGTHPSQTNTALVLEMNSNAGRNALEVPSLGMWPAQLGEADMEPLGQEFPMMIGQIS